MIIEDLFGVDGKIVLITGAGRGLGYAYAGGFAKAGATVVINDIDASLAEGAVEEIRNQGGRAESYPFDVSDGAAVEKNIERIEREVGAIDVLINNAGIHRRSPLEEMSEQDWRAVIDVNLNAIFLVTRCVVRGMIQRKRGKIINITSLNAEMARPTIANYCSAKGGLKMLTKAMATEWGRHNIQINAIGPGYFVTELCKHLAADPEFDAWVKENVPLQRWGDPSELIGTAIYLASKASDYLNGHTVYVDGGWRASL
jgi:gluconate 5-dehydrogenase